MSSLVFLNVISSFLRFTMMIGWEQMFVPPSGFIEKMCYLCIEFRQTNRVLWKRLEFIIQFGKT
jgi:hypothetical protein